MKHVSILLFCWSNRLQEVSSPGCVHSIYVFQITGTEGYWWWSDQSGWVVEEEDFFVNDFIGLWTTSCLGRLHEDKEKKRRTFISGGCVIYQFDWYICLGSTTHPRKRRRALYLCLVNRDLFYKNPPIIIFMREGRFCCGGGWVVTRIGDAEVGLVGGGTGNKSIFVC